MPRPAITELRLHDTERDDDDTDQVAQQLLDRAVEPVARQGPQQQTRRQHPREIEHQRRDGRTRNGRQRELGHAELRHDHQGRREKRTVAQEPDDRRHHIGRNPAPREQPPDADPKE